MAAAAPRAAYGVPQNVAPPAVNLVPGAPPTDAPVPDIVVDRRTDADGNIVMRRYKRGRLLGKVR
jgi:hypothetical protein